MRKMFYRVVVRIADQEMMTMRLGTMAEVYAYVFEQAYVQIDENELPPDPGPARRERKPGIRLTKFGSYGSFEAVITDDGVYLGSIEVTPESFDKIYPRFR